MPNSSTFNLNIFSISKDIQVKEIIKSSLFINWHDLFLKSGCRINQIKIHGAVYTTSTKIHSIFLEVNFTTPESHLLTRSILLKGKAVVIIPLVYSKDQLIPRFLMVKQRRICNGRFSLEFPSGKLEEGCTSIHSAQLEISEECGIQIPLDNLKVLAKSIIVCESSFDESVDWFYCKLDSTDISKLNLNLVLGNNFDGEYTYPVLTTFEILKKINSFQIKTGLELLFENKVLN
jgi:8-oxo-dGTP pyrophosphatase MutT (NUDIX family)